MFARVVTAGVAGAIPVVLAFHSGGYFPSEWGLELLVLGLIALAAVLLRDRISPAPVELAVVLGLVGLAAWTVLSVVWSPGVDEPVLAAQRTLVYAAGAAAVALAVTPDRVQALLVGLACGAATISLYALETRLIEGKVGSADDVLSGSRLIEPIGYANALGAVAALGLLLTLGLALFSTVASIRGAGGAALVPLAVALYLTLSRGSFLAVAAGLVAFGALVRGRSLSGGLLLVLPGPAIGVLLAQRSPLTRAGLDAVQARAAGHRLGWELALLALAGAAGGVLAPRLAPRLSRIALIGGIAVALGVVAIVAAKGPVAVIDRVADRIQATPPVTGGDLDRRVLSVSGNGRLDYWRVAWRMVERRPLLGEGGGTYERWWLQERPVASYARNAHNLYLETLAELGPVGLVLLLVALGAPLLGLRRCAKNPLAAGAAAAYVAWLVHAALDWDWQIPAVTLPALACGGSLLLLAREAAPEHRARSIRRTAAVGAIVPLLGVALVVHVGNRAADASQIALDHGDDAGAIADAHRARTWAPWAALPWQLLGEAQLAARDDTRARVSLREALSREPASWSAWYDLATVTTGSARVEALRRARGLNPLAAELSALR